jgi:hypothetical protein
MTEEQLIEGKPWFTREEFIKDSKMRSPKDPDYDKSTLYIPPAEW